MKYALGAVLAIINNQPVAARKALLFCDSPGGEHQVTQQAFVGIFSCTDALLCHCSMTSVVSVGLGLCLRCNPERLRRQQSKLTVMGFFGMTRMCTGACGLTSVNASARSSSNTTFAGISLRIIFPKILQPHGGQIVSKRSL